MKTFTRLSLLTAAAMSLAAASAALAADKPADRPTDRTDAPAPQSTTVVYVGQSQVILPAGSLSRPESPYALSGERRAPDAWERQGHWINAGQTRVFVPASAE